MELRQGNGLIVTEFIEAKHGFSTRNGGYSSAEYKSLNFGLSTGDDPIIVDKNRSLFYNYFETEKNAVCTVKQVHGSKVVVANKPSWFEHEADAIVSDRKDLLLIINSADCLPILFYDPIKEVIAAAHAGWRGTAAKISRNVVETMAREYGSKASDIIAVIGPGIAGSCYQVDESTVQKFRDAGFSQVYWPDGSQHYYLDILKANEITLLESGLLAENIHSLNLCTHCDSGLFFSHRRDGRARIVCSGSI